MAKQEIQQVVCDLPDQMGGFGGQSEEIRLIFDVQLYYSKMIESLSESSTDDK